jgi:hypothetical protein
MFDDELDLTEKTPKAREDAELSPLLLPLDPEWTTAPRVAIGTQTKLRAAPPPVPARARRSSTMPPPIPEAARPSPVSAAASRENNEDEDKNKDEDKSVDVDVSMPDPVHLPPLPKANPLVLGTSTQTRTMPPLPRARGTLPPPVRAQTGSGLFAISTVMPTKYQPLPVVEESRFEADHSSSIHAIDATSGSMAFEHPNDSRWWVKWLLAAVAGTSLLVGYLAFRGGGSRASSPTTEKVVPTRTAEEPVVTRTAEGPVVAPAIAARGSEPVVAPAVAVSDFDPKSVHEIAINLKDAPIAHISSAPLAPPPPSSRSKSHVTAPASTKRVAVAPQVAAVTAKPPATKLAQGSGVLMVSAKPPCQIAIDGKLTKLTTPQRSLAMSAGNHKITLINAHDRINKTVEVRIAAGQPTKLIQDFTKKK